MAARKTAAQKAAEAAERDEYTSYVDQSDHSAVEAVVARVEEAEGAEPGKLAQPKEKKETLQQLKNRLRNEAEREVLNRHKGEVIKITEAKYDEHGLEYVRRLTEEEKAAKVIEEMYQKFPNLRPQAEQQQAQLEDEADAARYSRGQAGADERGVPPQVQKVEVLAEDGFVDGVHNRFRAEDHKPEEDYDGAGAYDSDE